MTEQNAFQLLKQQSLNVGRHLFVSFIYQGWGAFICWNCLKIGFFHQPSRVELILRLDFRLNELNKFFVNYQLKKLSVNRLHLQKSIFFFINLISKREILFRRIWYRAQPPANEGTSVYVYRSSKLKVWHFAAVDIYVVYTAVPRFAVIKLRLKPRLKRLIFKYQNETSF